MLARREFLTGLTGAAGGMLAVDATMADQAGRGTSMVVDFHNHVIPRSVVEGFRSDPDGFGAKVEDRDGSTWLAHREGFAYPLEAEFLDPVEKVRALDRRGLDVAVVSPSPTLFFYRADAARNAAFVRGLNEDVADFVRAAPDRLRGMGTLPMQSPEASVAELDHLVTNLGIRAVIVGTHVDGVQLASARLRPVLRRAAELDVFVLSHPYYFGSKPGLEDYYLTNLIGNPLDTAVMAANLMFGGVFDELPSLKIGLSHGGGFLPYQIGRLAHGWSVRKEARTIATSPKILLRKFYYDTITHDPDALAFLIASVGADRVLLGTDTPFDMADETPLEKISAIVGLPDASRRLITGQNALRMIRG